MFMWAFDLIELNGDDLRREPLERRKSLARLWLVPGPGVRLNKHLEAEGPLLFEHRAGVWEAHQASDWSRRCQ